MCRGRQPALAARGAAARPVRGRRARAQPHVHLPVRRVQPEGRGSGGTQRAGERGRARAGSRCCSRWRSRRWDTWRRCGTSPRRSAAAPRFGRTNFPLDPGLPAGERGGEARALQRARPCSTSSSSSGRTVPARPRAPASAYERSYVRGGGGAPSDADGPQLRHRRGLLRRARAMGCAPSCAQLRRAATPSTATRRCSCRRRRSTSAGATAGALPEDRARRLQRHRASRARARRAIRSTRTTRSSSASAPSCAR